MQLHCHTLRLPLAGGGFDQRYNAQTLVDAESMLIMTPHVTQAVNDIQQVEPILDQLES